LDHLDAKRAEANIISLKTAQDEVFHNFVQSFFQKCNNTSGFLLVVFIPGISILQLR
jgi:hypothetical protein